VTSLVIRPLGPQSVQLLHRVGHGARHYPTSRNRADVRKCAFSYILRCGPDANKALTSWGAGPRTVR